MATANPEDLRESPTEYRQYVPAEKLDDTGFIEEIENHVRGSLSRMVSEANDENEFREEVVTSVRDSRRGGVWLHGKIDRRPVASYFTRDVPREDYAIDSGKKAADTEPTDLDPEEYQRHLEEKRRRVAGLDSSENPNSGGEDTE